jgi:NAD(P)-dependent dehydrogenase (short-subunit alcohol dehydrogenase family)
MQTQPPPNIKKSWYVLLLLLLLPISFLLISEVITYLTRFLTYFPNPILAGDVVLLTGGGSGIGRDAVLVLCGKGIHVVAGARIWPEHMKFTREEMKETSCNETFIHYLAFDVKDKEKSLASIDFALDLAQQYGTQYGGLIQSAGFANNVPVEVTDENTVRDIFDVNYFAIWRLIHASIPIFRKNKKGRIVTIGSIAGHLVGTSQSSYASSKHALEALHDALRREITPFGIATTLIDPGCVKSALFRYVLGGPHDPFTQIPPEKMHGYEWIPPKQLKELSLCEQFASHPRQSTSIDILDALTSYYPASHYYPGTFFIFPAKFIVIMSWIVPEKILDYGVLLGY